MSVQYAAGTQTFLHHHTVATTGADNLTFPVRGEKAQDRVHHVLIAQHPTRCRGRAEAKQTGRNDGNAILNIVENMESVRPAFMTSEKCSLEEMVRKGVSNTTK